jgi:hypothetical protein
MSRTTTAEVKEIIVTSLTDLDMFILPANLLVTEKLVGLGLSDETLEEIERWLAAHFLAVSKERQATKKRIGETEETYYWSKEGGLDSTTYGQTAKLLDTTGTLSRDLGKPSVILEVGMDLPTDA